MSFVEGSVSRLTRRSSTGILHNLNSENMFKLRIDDNNLHLNDLKCDS